MGREINGASMPQPFSSLPFLFLLLCALTFSLTSFVSAKGNDSSPPTATFSPPDNFLIDCGSPQQTKLNDGRTFKSDRDTSSLLSTNEDVQASVDSITANASSNIASSSQPLYRTARIFSEKSTYTFYINKPGQHWIRLYFHPLPHQTYNLTSAVFTVNTDKYVLLHDFSVTDSTTLVFKEYILNVTENRISLHFSPKKKSCAFVNAIEVVSAPDTLFNNSATSVSPVGDFNGLSNYAFQVRYRLNVGGPLLSPANDTLSRTWEPDNAYNAFPQGTQNVSVAPKAIKYPQSGATVLIAPNLVYASAQHMKDSATSQQNFNLTWKLNVEEDFSYLIRMHFSDIVSKALNTLYFNVYVNGMSAVSNLDLSSLTGALSTAYYKDFVLNATSISSENNTIRVQVGPGSTQSGSQDALLNGLEILKMSNIADSLDGLFGVDGSYKGPTGISTMKIVAGVGLGMGLTAMLLVVVVIVRWQRRPQGWEKRNSFSSWLLPLHSSQSSLFSSKSSSRRSVVFGSRKSKSSHSTYFSSTNCYGRSFTFSQLQNATQNFDEKAVIGVGGFGKVYLGVLEDGTKLAIKRGNPNSEQGINEFRTEMDMLSKLRHRHLVSLIGFCDENAEMILVYEYMANGPLRDHLYGSNQPPLSWKQRLEVCIGAARGLHYLHTGAAQGIIHRDVKTTNILLDENFVAKVSDFGLSKAAPTLEQTHVSTAVKGSFGYLDPEYFRRQQLTEKSDVYSFGVVLFEALCARPVINPALPREQVSLAEWAMQWHRKGMIEKIIDPYIASSVDSGSLRKFVEAAEKCLAEYGVDRPTMGDVLWNLEYASQLQEAASQIDPPEDKTSSLISLEKPSENDSKEGSALGSAVGVNDDSEVTIGSPAFAQKGNIQGR
ncbi:PREDICTED: probable receptor-like protein kinase At5g61350 [Prunus mume]|uniref:Probable receptor-like protein kinase At5g61350 n=1 Tax=Prunus mume TaxID=102107 RepID=A0ABM1LVD1_PRUMU|nr:PREDICTED: probable receptor-like protein kinase At5g61350 [Prunus mume]